MWKKAQKNQMLLDCMQTYVENNGYESSICQYLCSLSREVRYPLALQVARH